MTFGISDPYPQLLRSRPFDDRRLQFLPVRPQKYQMFVPVEGHLQGVTDDESLTDVTGTAVNTLSPGGINQIADLYGKDGPSM